MARVHVDAAKEGQTFYVVIVARTPEDDAQPWDEIGRGEFSTLAEAQRFAEGTKGAEFASVYRHTYMHDPDLDFEEVRWIEAVEDEEFNAYGGTGGADWSWDVEGDVEIASR